ncbi:acyl-homoserine-lactone synthase TraI [Rhizobium sullae]|uniref:acyl-homoserine-lactone synthase n=1 Tax=Rhizobium sullae TaxID=50338 RepID=UPI000B35A842|nr:acyl-homoserine-lactone synthase TraI [Rhizobium sullae]
MQIMAFRVTACGKFADLIDSMHRLRTRVFRDRLNWDVEVRNGLEADEYDQLDPTYILAVSSAGKVAGCARLLPATGPTMLANTFPQLLSSRSLKVHARMVESSRFCVDTSIAQNHAGGFLHRTTRMMFAGIIEWSIASGFHEIVTATDLRFERILKRAGWPMQRLGAPCPIGNTMAVAGTLPANAESFERLRPVGYRSAIGTRSCRCMMRV